MKIKNAKSKISKRNVQKIRKSVQIMFKRNASSATAERLFHF